MCDRGLCFLLIFFRCRMKKEHPGEEDTVISRGRVMGSLQPTRSFGECINNRQIRC